MSLERDRDDDRAFSLFGDEDQPHDVDSADAADDPASRPLTPEEEGRSFLGDLDERPRRRGRRGGLKSCLALIVVAALLVAGGVAAFSFGKDKIDALLAPPPDYTGEGTGKVLFEVKRGDTVSQIGRNLKSQGVVKSVDAFSDAAKDNADAQDIQVGFYELRKQLPAADALELLVDPDNLVQASVTIPEGLRVSDILPRLAKATDIPLAKFKAAVKDAQGIGLPSYAKGNAEGYLFPATYAFPPTADATEVLAAMVKRWRQAADEADLEGAADKLGYTPGELMIIASLVESEANRDQDRGKVARVIYNRLETDATDKRLQIDATVNYALGRNLGLGLTSEDLDVDSPYNTRKYPGLPPTPIEAPGDQAIEAAADPTPGNWIYYVTVDLDTGETRFTKDYDQFLEWKNTDLAQYCAKSDRC
jgi:UPF0755 protein